MKRILILPLILLMGIVVARAQLRPVTSAYTFGVGTSHLTDSYLTPLHYNGMAFSLNYERLQAMRANPSNLVMQLNVGIALDRAENPAKNATMWNMALNASWGIMRRWQLPQFNLTLAAGGMTGIDGGALYLARNGNNPVAAKAAWTVGATAMAVWRTKVWRLPIVLRYQPTIDLLGVFFSPDYGELYYEIWLGNHNGLAHFAWPGNRWSMQNLITADLRFGATALRLGYRNNILNSKVNNIVSRRTTHELVIGISGEWLSLSPSRNIAAEADVISAYY